MNFTDLPPELTFMILDNMSGPDLARLFSTNQTLRELYLPYYEEKIDLSNPEYVYPPESLAKFQERIDKEINLVTQMTKEGTGINPCILSLPMTRAMDLDNFHTFRGFAIYDYGTYLKWWHLYLRKNNLVQNKLVYPDDFITEILGITEPLPRIDFNDLLFRHVTCNVRIPLSPQIIIDLYREKLDL